MRHDIGETHRLLPLEGRTSTGGATRARSGVGVWSGRWRFSWGPVLPLLVAVGLLAVSMGAGRFAFSLSNGGPPALGGEGSLAQVQGLGVDIPTSVDYPDVGKTTEACATPSKPMLGGVDVVAYRGLEEGGTPIYGVPEHKLVYNGYTFLFSDNTNKARFEKSPLYFIPAWGGFCGWGISGEDWWTKYTLGPDADPSCWMITEDGVLRVFHSPTPKGYFMEDIPGNIEAGNQMWKYWWGDAALPGVNGTGTTSPLNTACLCSVDTCIDQ